MHAFLEVTLLGNQESGEVLRQGVLLGPDSQKYKDWRQQFFEKSWLKIANNGDLRDELILSDRSGQITSKADLHIPPTNPIISRETFRIAKIIMEHVSNIWTDSTTDYFVIHQSVLKDKDLVAEILEHYQKSKLSISILKIKDTDITTPDKLDLRNVYEEIQKVFCKIRMDNHSKCTILLDGGKLTFPSLVRI